MAYVNGYENDIFVSYSHVDNEPGTGDSKGWVSRFVRALETELTQQLGSRELRIWSDRVLAGNEPLQDQLLSTVRRSATLLVVMSPGYLNSEWCARERNGFLLFARDRVMEGRVFVVRLRSTETEQEAPELGELVGFQFFRENLDTGATLPLDSTDRDYLLRICELGQYLGRKLKELDARAEGPDAAKARPSKPHPKPRLPWKHLRFPMLSPRDATEADGTPISKAATGLLAVASITVALFLTTVLRSRLGLEPRLDVLFRVASALLAGFGGSTLSALVGLRRQSLKAGLGVALALVLGLANPACAPLIPPQDQDQEHEAEVRVDRASLERKVGAWSALVLSARGTHGGFRGNYDNTLDDQPWITAQVLVELLSGDGALAPEQLDIVRTGLGYLDRTRQPSGGWPLWDIGGISITEVSAWATIAELAALRREGVIPAAQREARIASVSRDLDFLLTRQDPRGGFYPMSTKVAENVRNYSTIMALWAMVEARELLDLPAGQRQRLDAGIRDGTTHLLSTYEPSLPGWGPRTAKYETPYVALTAHALWVIFRASALPQFSHLAQRQAVTDAAMRALGDEELARRDPNQNEMMDSNDAGLKGGQTLEGSTFLWMPWSLVLAAEVARHPAVSDELRAVAGSRRDRLLQRAASLDLEKRPTFQAAEYGLCIARTLESVK